MKKVLLVLLSCILIMASGITIIFADDIINDPDEPLEYSYELESSEEEPVINPRADIIKWRYKNINGHVYRRLYNYTKHKWIGNWEPI